MEAKSEMAEPIPAAAVASVFGNDDLLREILLRLGFPTRLVRAAAVSKRWLRNASDPGFLCRFRHPYPFGLLGFCIRTAGHPRALFVPMMPQAPELVTFIRRGGFDLPDGAEDVWDCRGGRLVVSAVGGRYAVCSPLYPARGVATFPSPCIIPGTVRRPLISGDDGDHTAVALVVGGKGVWVHLSDLQARDDGAALELVTLPRYWGICPKFGLLTYGNLYMISIAGHIIGLDLPTRSLFYIDLPEGVSGVNFKLSRAEGTGFYLIQVKEFQIHIWLHSTGNNAGNWDLVDTICLHQVLGNLAHPTWLSEGAVTQVAAVGDNADFLFLRIEYEVFYMHKRSRAVEKVYELQEPDCDIHPFMMVWPPTFPALDDGLSG
ncbi:unnamed protein product [Urochloa decumbens]|uniref:F-box protein AT5G49610-like beta-propeller domain-containing protein n=1 Tax=Urochloa decumbens TaxID=240449 RepID=A0ABC9A2F9_9POAL